MKYENFRLTELDCGDNSCRYAPKENKGGMRTNGGCRCHNKICKLIEDIEYDYGFYSSKMEILLGDFDRIVRRSERERFGADNQFISSYKCAVCEQRFVSERQLNNHNCEI